jgi:predicted dehydrogenase
MTQALPTTTRREFLRASALVAGAAAVIAPERLSWGASRRDLLRVGVIGCGGRGTGAARDILATGEAEIVALGDALPDRLASCRSHLESLDDGLASRVRVGDERCFTGLDAFERVCDCDLDIVILAAPPGFRPRHFEHAVARGHHVFMEKPVAVDPSGVRRVIDAARRAEDRGLCVVAGTQRRHSRCYLEAVGRIMNGAIGRVVAAECYWMQGGLWMNERKPEWSDVEWQLRNWLYFTWLSGDHIVEQHVHNLDVVNWVLGTPVRVRSATGGRQVRTDHAYGHVFDHFAVVYEYESGVSVTSMCQQIDNTQSRCEEVFHGTLGKAVLAPGRATITGPNAWHWSGQEPSPYEQEQADLVHAIRSGRPLNEGVRIAESTLTAIMGRESAYTGKPLTWQQALGGAQDLMPANLTFGPLPTPPVPMPGRTRFE